MIIPERYFSDCERVHKLFLDRNIFVDVLRIYAVWDHYSDTMAAGWLRFPDTDEEIIEQFQRLLS